MTKVKNFPKLDIQGIVAKLSAGQKIEYPTQTKIGVILVNTGTPLTYSFSNIWRYLREFLSDYRVVEAPRLIWYPVLYLYVLMTRPFKKAPSYKSIWNKELDESPLRTISRSQAAQLQARFNEDEGRAIQVEYAFRYGTPSINEKVAKLHTSGCDRLVVFPLFPQYSSPTTGSCCDEVFRALLAQRHQMAVHTVHAYYSNPEFIRAIADSLQASLESNINFDAIVVTYHGIPLKFQNKGDPYGKQCHETTAMIQAALDARKISIPLITTFQSRLGRNTWLQPYTDETVIEMAKNGYSNLMVIAPGFSTDCLETLEELEIELASDFKKFGGNQLVYVRCLNDTKAGIDVIEHVTRKEIQGFL